MNVEHIRYDGDTVAIIFYNHPVDPGVHFYSENDSTLQVGKQLRLKGEEIKPHRHLPVKVDQEETLKEVLYIEKGRIKVKFYNDHWEEVDSRVLGQGDMILLIRGSHGFEILEETLMIEIKQGPYNPSATIRKKDGS